MSQRADVRYFTQEEIWKTPVQEQVAVADELISMIPDGVRTILDAGCGNGVVTNRLIDRWEVVGCDLSETALKQVRAKTMVVDLAAIPLRDMSFDLVLASDVIEHLPDEIYAQALRELTRVAKRYVLIAVPHDELLQAAEVKCPRCAHRYHAHLHQRRYSAESVSGLLGPDFGLCAGKLSGERWVYSSPSLLAARQWLTGQDYPFEDAVCPACGQRRGEIPVTAFSMEMGRRCDAIQAMLAAEGALPMPGHSELLLLFERGRVSKDVRIDVGSTEEMRALIEVATLERVRDPRNYPSCALRIEAPGPEVILAFPKSAERIEIRSGNASAFEVYDYVRQRYELGVAKADGVYLPVVPYGPQGCLVRISGASSDLQFHVALIAGRSHDEIVNSCLSDDMAVSRLMSRLTEANHALDEMEERRARLEQLLQGRERTIGELESKRDYLEQTLQGRERTIGELESKRDYLEQTLQGRERIIGELESKRDHLERMLRGNELAIGRLESTRNQLEEMLSASEFRLRDAEQRNTQLNDLANRLEAQREALNTQVTSLAQAYADKVRDLNVCSLELAQLTEENLEATLNLKAAQITFEFGGDGGVSNGIPKRVLILSHMYPRDYHPAGGIFVHEQVKALRAMGIDARVLSGEPYWINTLNPIRILRAFRSWLRCAGYGWEERDGVPLIRFPYIVSGRFLPFEAHAMTYSVGALRCIARLTERFDFQLVHSHTAYTDGSAGVKVARKYKVPLVITEHTGPFRTLTKSPYLRWKTGAAINSADRIVAVSSALLRDMKDQISFKHPERASVIPNMVDVGAFVATPRAESSRINVLWVGHFVAVKRVEVLLQAMAIAVKHQPNLRLKLVGSGELEESLRQLAASLALNDYVEFAGSADRTRLPELYQACDFLAISSEVETFGVVAIEALSCGRPVLSTDCGGPEDIITHPSLGQIVGKSAEAIADGILAMASRRNAFDFRLIRKVVELKYSSFSVAKQISSTYSKLLVI